MTSMIRADKLTCFKCVGGIIFFSFFICSVIRRRCSLAISESSFSGFKNRLVLYSKDSSFWSSSRLTSDKSIAHGLIKTEATINETTNAMTV